MRILTPGIAVAAQRVDGHQPLDKQIGQLDKEAEFGRVQHQRGKLLAHAVLHEANLLPLHQLAFGFGGAALGLAGFLGDLGQLGLRNWRLPGESTPLLRAFSPMNHNPGQTFIGVRPR